VSYVSRGLGVGNADTVQQRARWFGYKREYLGFCRVYLPGDSITAYRDYVEHEEFVRRQLQEHLAEGKSLSEWRRKFILSGTLHPTRSSVVRLSVRRGVYEDRWFSPQSPHSDPGATVRNRVLVQEFVEGVEWTEWNDDPRLRDTHRHHEAECSLDSVREFLVGFKYSSLTDSTRYTGVLVQIMAFLEDNSGASCRVFRMRPDATTRRGTDDRGIQISELFQGGWPVEGPRIYPGDRAVRADGQLSLQIHTLDVFRGAADNGDLISENVPALALWVPNQMATPWLVQEV
jgi:hypothetical protein